MNIQTIIKLMINSGIEENEAKYEIKMLLEHFVIIQKMINCAV